MHKVKNKWIERKSQLAVFFCLSIVLNALFTNVSYASQPGAISSSDHQIIIEKIAKQLKDYYVFPEVGSKAGEYIRLQLKNKEYLGYDSLDLFADRLTDDLQEFTLDKHIRVRLHQPYSNLMPTGIENDYGFKKTEILDGNVGLITFNYFSSDHKAKVKVDKIFSALNDVDALIIDLRKNGGGDPDLVRYISSYFFDKKTHLNSLYWRETNSTEEYWTLDKVPGVKKPDLPIYILTSSYTFSAAEEFAYNLKVRKRAYIVGETTKGGANPGRVFDLPKNLSIFIPNGKAINPITKTNWEGTGVKPDLPVIAVKAFEEAYAMAKYSAIEYRVTQGKAKPEEKYSITKYRPSYGKWHLARNSCPLKYRIADPSYNGKTRKYQFPYQVKYYGNGSIDIQYQFGNKSGKMKQNVYFKNREEEKSGISIGFVSPDALYISDCKIL